MTNMLRIKPPHRCYGICQSRSIVDAQSSIYAILIYAMTRNMTTKSNRKLKKSYAGQGILYYELKS